MRRKTLVVLVTLVILSLAACLVVAGGGLLWNRIRPQPKEVNKTIYKGITYTRLVHKSPRPMVIHIIRVDLRQEGISLLVTPGDPKADLSLSARTTSQFLKEYDLQIAINGDAFIPWHSNSILDYYPHSGDRVEPIGFAASQGEIYSQETDDEPVLYISPTNRARFNQSPGKIYNAISGNQMIVERGSTTPSIDNVPQPRTAVGLNKQMRELIIVVIDGRQPGYSEGATLAELSTILIEAGAYNAMNLDGGGSSTLVKQGALNQADVLNSPIEHQIPGFQRAVGNHLGIYAQPTNGD